MKEKIKSGYVAPEVLVVQLKTRNCLLAGSLTETMGEAEAMRYGSFNARGSRFSTWDDEFDEE